MSQISTAVVCGVLRTAPEGDYFVTCSFDPNHVMLRSKMPYHIVKCVKNHPGHNKAQCPYDATEYIDTDKLSDHLLICESRRSLYPDKHEVAELKARGLSGKIAKTPFVHACAPVQDEEWSENPEFDYSKNYVSSSDDVISPETIEAVGRGVKPKKSIPSKGMGRAALLHRIYQDYKEKLSSSSSTSSNDNSLPENIRDQFVDA